MAKEDLSSYHFYLGGMCVKKLILFAFIVLSSEVFAKKFIIDSSQSSIEFSVKHLGLSPVKGRFTKFEGFVAVDPKKMMARKVSVKIDVDSINTDNNDRDTHLKSKDFFHVRNEFLSIIPANRHMQFTANGFSLKDTSKLKGTLRILKKKKKVDLTIKIKSMKRSGKIWKITITADGEIDRKDYGLTWQKPSSGLKEKLAGKFVGDEVKLMVTLSFQDKKK